MDDDPRLGLSLDFGSMTPFAKKEEPRREPPKVEQKPAANGRVPDRPDLSTIFSPDTTIRSTSSVEDLTSLMKKAEERSGILSMLGNLVKVDYAQLKHVCDIGHGSCGTVTKRSYQGFTMAVKTMHRNVSPYEMSRILMDLNVICRSFDCEYIVRCYGYFITPTDVSVCMEHMATCLDRLLIRMNHEPIPEDIIGKMSISIINALHYLKSRHKIMHRDVKPSNILLDWNGVVKLCDFGIAGQLIESRAHSKMAGCSLYMGPERLDPKNLNSYDIRSDVWSLGLTLMELATGHYPYKRDSEFEMMTAIMTNEPPKLNPGKVTPEFFKVVDSCLRRNPLERPRYEDLLRSEFILKHEDSDVDVEEWFSSVMMKDD